MEEPKVSIAIPVYNAAKYLKECLDSVVNQTYKNLEIILINDGSTDNSAEILEEYKKNDERIITITQPNSGVSVTRNNLKASSTGKYLMYVDSDDYLELNAVETLVNLAEKENTDLIIFDYYEISQDKKTPKGQNTQEIKFYDKKEACYQYIKGNDNVTFIIWRKFYKTSIAQKVIFPKDMIPEDMATGLDFLYYSDKIMHYSQCLYNYRLLPNSLTTEKSFKKDINIYNMNVNEYNKRMKLFPEFKIDITSKYYNSLINMYGVFSDYPPESSKEYLDDITSRLKKIKFNELNLKSKLVYLMFIVSKKWVININKKRVERRRMKRYKSGDSNVKNKK